MQGLMKTPLSPAPNNIYLSQKSSRWRTIGSMLGLVTVIFFYVNTALFIVSGFIDSNLNGILGPSDPLQVMIGTLCSTPFLLAFILLRKPKLAHVVRIEPSNQGTNTHLIAPSTLIQTPMQTSLKHHLVHNTAPLQIPPLKQLWLIFFFGTLISTICMIPILISSTIWAVLLFLLIAIPAWIIGFSTPVFAWWATSNEYFGLQTTKRQGEWMLIAGMLSTFPALVINSLISPIIITFLGISMDGVESLGYGMILFLSAPIGEELSKALAILFLSRFIDSGKRGFQIGFSVGLGFALLENMSYILGALLSGESAALSFILTTVLRAIGSIPGHATWTAISGFAIGHHISKNNHSKSLIDGIYEKKKITKQESQWALFDNKTGELISSSSIKPQTVLPKWLSAGKDKEIKITKSPTLAIFVAIFCHAIWNGTLWISGRIFIDSPILIKIVIDLVLVTTLIVILWFILRRLIPYAVDDRNSLLS
ncbi:MAG: hypothetical protein CL978_01925 [Euryarchaeota archaeon]|jgi:RsiW-degrading membrane proteinase PrsW (M82 family)|nr:hypothetical protein [Euryarchaeota archaeon]|tara:strand:- start:178 stop:1620 length:1443 start_codon:yes stop_codon:yes gene_type:complete